MSLSEGRLGATLHAYLIAARDPMTHDDLLKAIQSMRQRFQALFHRPMTDEEQRVLDLAEQFARQHLAEVGSEPPV